jgi:RecA/RadA recombinase
MSEENVRDEVIELEDVNENKMVNDDQEEEITENLKDITKDDGEIDLESVELGKNANSVDDELVNLDNTPDDEILNSIALSDKPVEVKKRGGRPKKDTPTPNEVANMSDAEVLSADDQVQSLYDELSSFLETKADMKQEVGDKQTISTGIDILDAYMGGGFALGTMSLVTGTPGCGKSTLASQVIGNAQRQFNGKILAGYLDSEEAVTKIRLSNLGVKNPTIKPYNDVTIEKVFKYIEGMCLFKAEKKIIDTPTVIVWDSVANTLSQKEREAEDPNSVIGYKARALSLLLPQAVSKLAAYNICLICVNQLRDLVQIGQFAPAKEIKFMTTGKDIPGGNALKFNAFHWLEMSVKDLATVEKYGFDGFFAQVHCVKNKLFTPNIKFKLAGNFVTGFSNFWTNYIFLVANKRLVTGSWNYLVSNTNIKFRTKDALTMYNENELFKQAYDEAVKEAIQTEIIEKYT